MKIAIVGPGRVGTVLALALPRAGHRVVAVAGGSPAALEAFHARVSGVRATSLGEAAERAELLVLATPDARVASVARNLAADDLVGPSHRVVHLAGALGLDALRTVALTGAGTAALHPAQTVPQGAAADALVGCAWAVTASEANRAWAHGLVGDLGGDSFDVRDEDRVLYHAGLVLGSNAVAAAMSAARQLLVAARIGDPAAFLRGLGTRSLQNVLSDGAGALTGPVVRGDVETVARHLEALDRDVPEIATAYRHLQRAVVAQAGLGLDAATVERLLTVLADGRS